MASLWQLAQRHLRTGLAALGAAVTLLIPPPAAAEEGPSVARICELIEGTAETYGLDPAFFARLIWKESRFDHRALSPAGAEGIAQFMPATARERGLSDLYDPAQAIPASAAYLYDLRKAFGNWGLAAAAYNGGPSRVERFVQTGARLPWETIEYVRSITYRPVEWFRGYGREVEPRPLDPDRPFAPACRDLPVMETRAVLDVNAFPWGVQIAGAASPNAARRAYARLERRYPSVFDSHDVVVMRNRRARIAAPYIAQIGAPSRAEAGRICSALRREGGACVVRRN